MDKYSDYLRKKHFPITRSIDVSEYTTQKSKLSEEEFNKKYIVKNFESYHQFYEIIADNPTDAEYTIYLLDELLEQQKITARKTSIIAGVVIFWLICSIVSGIYIAVTLSNLL